MRRWLAVACLLAALGPLDAFPAELPPFPQAGSASLAEAAPPEPPDAGTAAGPPGLKQRLGDDFRSLGHSVLHPDRRSLQEIGLGALAVGAVSAFDESIRDSVQSRTTDSSRRLAEDVRPLDEAGGLALLGVAWGAGAALHRPKVVLVAQDGLEATVIAAGLIAPTLKLTVGRARPHEELGAFSFSPFSGNQSFPSGESAEAFAIASAIATHSERRWVEGLAYGLAGVVSLNRIVLDAHWTSDVVAGALIGDGVGHWVARRHRGAGEEKRPSVSFAPGLGRDRRSLEVAVAW